MNNKKKSKLRSTTNYDGRVKVNGDELKQAPSNINSMPASVLSEEKSANVHAQAYHGDYQYGNSYNSNLESFHSNNTHAVNSNTFQPNTENSFSNDLVRLDKNSNEIIYSDNHNDIHWESNGQPTNNHQSNYGAYKQEEGYRAENPQPKPLNMTGDVEVSSIRISSDGHILENDYLHHDKDVSYHYSDSSVGTIDDTEHFRVDGEQTLSESDKIRVSTSEGLSSYYVEDHPGELHSQGIVLDPDEQSKDFDKIKVYSHTENPSSFSELRNGEDYHKPHDRFNDIGSSSRWEDESKFKHSEFELGIGSEKDIDAHGESPYRTVIRKTDDGFVVEQDYGQKSIEHDSASFPLKKTLDDYTPVDSKSDYIKLSTKNDVLNEKISVGDDFGENKIGLGEKPSKIKVSEKTKLKVKELGESEGITEITGPSKPGKKGLLGNSLFNRSQKNPVGTGGATPSIQSTGSSVLQKALSISLAGGICVGAFGGMQMMMQSTFMWVPNAAHYYTDGTPQTGEEEAENKEAIQNGTANYFSFTSSDSGEEEKILITQAAVNAMAELQSSYEDSAFDDSELDDLECIEITENGMLIDASKLSGKSYMDYTGSYVATGIPLTEKDTIHSVPQRPKFDSVPVDKRGNVRIEVKYFNDNSASIRYYYPNSTSNVTQYLGNLNFSKEGAYIAGWSTQKDSADITFETYQKLDETAMQTLVNMSNSGDNAITLYPVWVDNNISTKIVDIGVVTEEEIAGDLASTFTESDLSIQYAYVDEGGNVQFTVENTDITYMYSRDELFKAILAMATVATENSVANPDVYISYCESLLEKAIKGYKGYSVSYSAKEIPNSLGTDYGISWTENGVEYAANGAKLSCNVTIYVNPSIESMMAGDKTSSDWFKEQGLEESTFEGWTEDNKEWARSYMELSVDDFIEFFQVAFPAQAAYMAGYDNASVIFNMLVGHGYSTAAALGILGNLMQESGLDPTAFNSIGMVGIMQTFQKRLDDFAALQGEAWPNVSLTTQVEFIVYECEQTYNYTSSYSYGSSYLDDYVDEYGLDYCYMPIEDFKKLSDIEQATVVFCASYEKPQLWEANMKQRIEYAFEFADRIVYGNSSGAQGYISWAVSIAEDDSHGYSMARRTGPDYDCSSFVYYALLNGGYEEIESYYSYPFTVDYIASTLTEMGFTIIPYSYDSLVAGDILISAGDAHTEIYIGDDQLVGAHGCEPSASHPGRSPQTGDQDGSELSVCPFFDLEEQPWVTIVRPPMGSGTGNATQNGVLQANHHISFYSQFNDNGEEDYSNASERYNSGVLCDGQAATADPDLPIGTVIYVVTTASGTSSAANGRYYIITDVINEDEAKYNSDYIIRLFHEVVASNTENRKAPYGSSTTAKIYKVDTEVTWNEYISTYGK